MSNDDKDKKYDETDPKQNPAHIENGNLALQAARTKHAAWMKRPEKERKAFLLEKCQAATRRIVDIDVDWAKPSITPIVTPTTLPLEAPTRERAFLTQSGLLLHEFTTWDSLQQLEIEPVAGVAFVLEKAIERKEKNASAASPA